MYNIHFLLIADYDFYSSDDWDGTYGNPGKLGLSLIAMVFDGIFMTQHFILYSGELDDQ